MYGMIHRAIRSMIIEEKGEDVWNDLERRTGFSPAEMISGEVYSDEITLALLAAASDCMKISAEELLIRFGKFWIFFAERGSFSHIMDFTGKDIESFVANLDRMHEGVRAVMPQAVMPSFKVVDTAPGMISVSYSSPRAGLEPFVLGLLHGLLDRFGLDGNVEQGERRDDALVYVLRYRSREAA